MRSKLIKKFKKNPRKLKNRIAFYGAYAKEVMKECVELLQESQESKEEISHIDKSKKDLREIQKKIDLDLLKLVLVNFLPSFRREDEKIIFFQILDILEALIQSKYGIDYFLPFVINNLPQIIFQIYIENNFSFGSPSLKQLEISISLNLFFAFCIVRNSKRVTRLSSFQEIITGFIEPILFQEIDVFEIKENRETEELVKASLVAVAKKKTFDSFFVIKFMEVYQKIVKVLDYRVELALCLYRVVIQIRKFDESLLEDYEEFLEPTQLACIADGILHYAEGPKCGNCKKREDLTQNGGKKYQVCSGCSKIYYCSKSCQRMHWKIHKKICNHATN